MAMVTITSSGLTPKLSYESSNNNNLRAASFSSYLNSAEESFVRKLAESSQNLSPVMSTQEEQDYLGRKKEEEDGEIGVFSAEKYFNGVMDDSPRVPKLCKKNRQYVEDPHHHQQMDLLAPVKPKIQSGTPSVRSESSWNSQNALIQSASRNNPSRRKENKPQKKKFLAGLRSKCSCSDKDSVEITEHVGETSFKKSSSPNCGVVKGNAIQVDELAGSIKEEVGLIRENCFSFPTTNSVVGNLPVQVKVHFQEDQEDEKLRKSLEAFGCPVLEKRDSKSSSIDKRLALLSWDATKRVEDIKFSAIHGENYNIDTESDASSDLFEIESLTGKVNPFLARQGSDITSDCVTPTAYAPSEASIEWSVITASAADFSVMSDYEELRPATTMTSPVKAFSANSNAKTKTSMEMPRRRPGISLGCKSHKAVRVAGDACYRTNEKANYDQRMHRMSDSFTPTTRFQAETKIIGFDSRQRQHALAATRSLPRSHSPRPSHLLYIQ